jgi:Protein of unknown function (DUF2971)
MILRRYLKAEGGIRTLADLRFRIGRIHEVNDPSEFLANYKFKGRPLPATTHKCLTDHLKNHHTKDKGILCFSNANVSNQLMWGHYAEGGRGVCVEVESDQLGFGPHVLFPINYEQPQEIEVENFFDATPETQAHLLNKMELVLKNKSGDWRYELEHRAFVSLKGENSTIDPVTKEVSFHYDINPEAIRAVYIGAAAKQETIHSIANCMRHYGFDAKLKMMVIDATSGSMYADNP